MNRKGQKRRFILELFSVQSHHDNDNVTASGVKSETKAKKLSTLLRAFALRDFVLNANALIVVLDFNKYLFFFFFFIVGFPN